MTTDNRTLAEIKQDHQYETSYAIKNANAIYFKSQDAAYKFWGMCHFKAITALGIKPEDMERAVATDDGVVNSAFTLDNVRVEVKHFGAEEWKLGTYFYKLKPYSNEIDELAYFLSHVEYFDNPIKDCIELTRGNFRIITNIPYEDSRKKVISFPKVAYA